MRAILITLMLFASQNAWAEEFRLIDLKKVGLTETVAYVRWQQPVVTFSYVEGPTEFQGSFDTKNCGRMVAIDVLFRENPALDRGLFHREVVAGLRIWEKYVPFRFAYTPQSDNADLLIGAQAHPRRVAFVDLRFDVTADGRYKPLEKAAICLNPVLSWHTGVGSTETELSIGDVLAHECGHMIGLDHAKDPGALMDFRLKQEAPAFTETDRRGAQVLYGSTLALGE